MTDAANEKWPNRVRRLIHRLPYVCGGLSVAVGAFVLVGWRTGRLLWTTAVPGLPPMVANAALMSVLAGVSLTLSAPLAVSTLRSTVSRLCAAAVTLIAGLTLIEHVFGFDLSIDQMLVTTGETTFDRHPGRASPQTATAFALIGASLLSINRTTARGRRPAQVLATIAALIPLVAVLVYVFGTAELYGAAALYPYIGMGIPTATALLALSTGVVAARSDEGLVSVLMAGDSGGLAARRLVASLVVLALATCGIEAGARIGLYAAPIGSAGIMLFAIVGGSAFVLRVSKKLSRLDAAAQQAIRARDDLMGVVAHDLRNPLSAILMAASFLRSLRPNGGGPADESTGVIERSAKRMNRLIEDLLDATRIEAGRLSLERVPIDSVRLVADSVDAQRPIASSGHVDLGVDAPAPLPEVLGDRDRLLQVFENLIGNAVKFTEPEGRITVGARAQGHEVVFWVSDTGNGIAAEDLPRLFDRFWQARGAKRQGAGLGLPIVKGIVEAHGGRVWVESIPRQGSTFSFSIPVANSR